MGISILGASSEFFHPQVRLNQACCKSKNLKNELILFYFVLYKNIFIYNFYSGFFSFKCVAVLFSLLFLVVAVRMLLCGTLFMFCVKKKKEKTIKVKNLNKKDFQNVYLQVWP